MKKKKIEEEEEEERSGEKRNITEQVKGLYSSYRGHVRSFLPASHFKLYLFFIFCLRGRFFLFPLLFYLESNLVKIVGLKDYCGRGLSVVHGDAGPPLRWRVGRRPAMRDVNKIAHVSMHEI